MRELLKKGYQNQILRLLILRRSQALDSNCGLVDLAGTARLIVPPDSSPCSCSLSKEVFCRFWLRSFDSAGFMLPNYTIPKLHRELFVDEGHHKFGRLAGICADPTSDLATLNMRSCPYLNKKLVHSEVSTVLRNRARRDQLN